MTQVRDETPSGQLTPELRQQLVHQPLSKQRRVQDGTALAQRGLHAVPLAQDPDERGQPEEPGLVARLFVRARRVRRAQVLDARGTVLELPVGPRDHHHSGIRILEQRYLGNQRQPCADDHGQRIRVETRLAATLAPLGVAHEPPVPLRGDGAGADEHRVRLATELVEELAVRLVADRPGAPADRDAPIRSGREVGGEVRPVGMGRRLRPPGGRGVHGAQPSPFWVNLLEGHGRSAYWPRSHPARRDFRPYSALQGLTARGSSTYRCVIKDSRGRTILGKQHS